jgi:single-strand selective monofunctional uracil DNA glycosylase
VRLSDGEKISGDLIMAARKLALELDKLKFSSPVTHVYNPLRYAAKGYELYLRKYASGPKRVMFLGMNPGPFGMAQTGVPFGEVTAVRHWLNIRCGLERPLVQHPARPVLGFDCPRSEVSGARLWGLFSKRFGTARRFFRQHIVMNYCPLTFMEASGRNRTPDKLPPKERLQLFALCDEHLKGCVKLFQPEWVIGVGAFALRRAEQIIPSGVEAKPKLACILHPSPASPAANKDWAKRVTQQLVSLGVWS